MVKTISERLEIAFWAWMIPLMRQSPLVQAALPTTLQLLQRRGNMKRIVILLAWAWAGLFVGLVLGLLHAKIG